MAPRVLRRYLVSRVQSLISARMSTISKAPRRWGQERPGKRTVSLPLGARPPATEHRTHDGPGVDIWRDPAGAAVARDQGFRRPLRYNLECHLGRDAGGLPNHGAVGAATNAQRQSHEERRSGGTHRDNSESIRVDHEPQVIDLLVTPSKTQQTWALWVPAQIAHSNSPEYAQRPTQTGSHAPVWCSPRIELRRSPGGSRRAAPS